RPPRARRDPRGGCDHAVDGGDTAPGGNRCRRGAPGPVTGRGGKAGRRPRGSRRGEDLLMPRERIAMSEDEVARFLAAKRTAILGLRGADGAPGGTPATISDRDGVLVVALPAGGDAARNLRRDPRIVVSVEEYPSYARIRGVAVHGRAVSLGAEEGRERFRIDQARVESFDFAKMKRAPAE